MASRYSPTVSPSPRRQTSNPTQTSRIKPDLKPETEGFAWLLEENPSSSQDQLVELLDTDFVNPPPLHCPGSLHNPLIAQRLDGRDWSAVWRDPQIEACAVPGFVSQSAFVRSGFDFALQPSNQSSSPSTRPAPPISAAAPLIMLTDGSSGGLSFDMIGAWDPSSQLATSMNPRDFQPYSRTDGRNMPASSGEHRDPSSDIGLSDEYCASPLPHRVT